jgi:hypothetical protein
MSKTEPPCTYDVFVAHASEDNDSFVVALVRALRGSGLGVWYSGIDSPYGSSAKQPDSTLASFLKAHMNLCHTGILVISKAFLSKQWPRFELDHWISRAIGANRVIAVLHGAGIDAVSAVAALDTPHLTASWDVIPSWKGVESISAAVVGRCPPRAVMHHMLLEGPGEIVVSAENGHFWVGQRGGMFGDAPANDVAFYDFVGNKIHNEYFEATARFMEVDSLVIGKGHETSAGAGFSFTGPVRFVYMNHLRIRPVTEDEVRRGAFLNFGTNDRPIVAAPFFTCPGLTAAIGHETLPEVLEKGLAVARGGFEGQWFKFVLTDDGKGFNIESRHT